MSEYELIAAAGKLVRGVPPGPTGRGGGHHERYPERGQCGARHGGGGSGCRGQTAGAQGGGSAGGGDTGDPDLPVQALARAIAAADVWVEYNRQWLLYSRVYEQAIAANSRLCYVCLCGMTADVMVRAIGRVDFGALRKFLEAVRDLTARADRVRVTTPAGTDVSFRNLGPDHCISCDWGDASTPGVWMLRQRP